MSAIAELRAQFPIFASFGASRFHYLDNAATAQICAAALDAVHRHDTTARANVQRGGHRLAERADAAYADARERIARFLNAPSADEVVVTSGATASINLVARALEPRLARGDEILVSVAEHHSNFVPWQMLAERTGAKLVVVPLGADARIDLDAAASLAGPRCRLIAMTQGSNVTGALTDVPALARIARRVGAQLLIDGTQAAQHGPVDVQALGVDYYVLSGHKCFGPTGVGALWVRAGILETLPAVCGGGGAVAQVALERTTFADGRRRFEPGTPPIAQAVGFGAALHWMSGLDWDAIASRERQLAARLIQGLGAVPRVRVVGPMGLDARLPVVSFDVEGVHPHDVCQVLDAHGVAVRGGHHCAQPLMRACDLDGTVRASLALYNDVHDVAALLNGLDDTVRTLR